MYVDEKDLKIMELKDVPRESTGDERNSCLRVAEPP